MAFETGQLLTLKPRRNDRNISTQYIATLLGATCCARLATLLQRVATCWVLKIGIVRMPGCNILHERPQHHATSTNVAWKSDQSHKFELPTPNMSQHVATGWPNGLNRLRPTMSRSFGQGFMLMIKGSYKFQKLLQARPHYAEGIWKQRRIKCFPCTLCGRYFKNATINGHFGFEFDKTSVKENTWLSWPEGMGENTK